MLLGWYLSIKGYRIRFLNPCIFYLIPFLFLVISTCIEPCQCTRGSSLLWVDPEIAVSESFCKVLQIIRVVVMANSKLVCGSYVKPHWGFWKIKSNALMVVYVDVCTAMLQIPISSKAEFFWVNSRFKAILSKMLVFKIAPAVFKIVAGKSTWCLKL